MTAYGSGNLAQVYFDLYPRKITLSELNAAYPGMVDALVQHEGIGLVCGYEDDGTPIALGKSGQRNLYSGEVTGEDPLLPYAPADPNAYGHASVEKRAWQVRRVMDFPHAGDLMVISTVYPDGTVAALEELIGSHGGLGGEQTDAFLFHPPDFAVPDTRNATDVYHILNAVRGAPVPAKIEAPQSGPIELSAWSLSNLARGIGQIRVWLGHLFGALTLDRSTYRAVAKDPSMTGPALLIVALVSLVREFFEPAGFGIWPVILIFLTWPLPVLAVFAAGRLLSGKGEFTRTLRALGFAQSVHFLELLAFIPPIAPLIRALVSIMAYLAIWVAAAAAHETKGWRTLLLPLSFFAVSVVVVFVLISLVGGIDVTLSILLDFLGLAR